MQVLSPEGRVLVCIRTGRQQVLQTKELRGRHARRSLHTRKVFGNRLIRPEIQQSDNKVIKFSGQLIKSTLIMLIAFVGLYVMALAVAVAVYAGGTL